jgi:hypothetical protein
VNIFIQYSQNGGKDNKIKINKKNRILIKLNKYNKKNKINNMKKMDGE